MTLQPFFILCTKMLPDYWKYFSSLFSECISVYFFYGSVFLYAFNSLYVPCRHKIKSLSVVFQYICNVSTCLFLKVISFWKNEIFLLSPLWALAKMLCEFLTAVLKTRSWLHCSLSSPCFLPLFAMWFSRYFWELEMSE